MPRHRRGISKETATELLADVNAACKRWMDLVRAEPMDLAAAQQAQRTYHDSLVHLHGALQYYANGCASSPEAR